jgi:hypothetical protein
MNQEKALVMKLNMQESRMEEKSLLAKVKAYNNFVARGWKIRRGEAKEKQSLGTVIKLRLKFVNPNSDTVTY